MRKITIPMQDGSTVEVEGHEYRYMIKGEYFRFVCHESVGLLGLLTVSHYPSGRQMFDLGVSYNIDPRREFKDRMGELIKKYGEDRVYRSLKAA